jgi:hypothetical protein
MWLTRDAAAFKREHFTALGCRRKGIGVQGRKGQYSLIKQAKALKPP